MWGALRCGLGVLAVLPLLGCAEQSSPVARSSSALDSQRRGVWQLRSRGSVSVQDHARLVYDAGLGRVLLVSSRPAQGVWAWDGARWTFVAEALGTLYRQGVAYDSTRGRVVVFGGQEADHTTADTSGTTWTFDGESWQVAAETGPSERGGASLAFDAARDRVVLVGGVQQLSGRELDETWLFDGTTWTQATPATPAPAVSRGAVAFDARRERVVLARPMGDAPSETWEWDGTDWARIDTPAVLPDSYTYALAWDADAEQVVALAAGELWQYDGTTWSRRDTDDGRTVERAGGSIAHDAGRHVLVVHRGGGTTWEHDGSRWLAVPHPEPVARFGAGVAYDAARDRVVVVGGYGEMALDETWEWDGAAWAQGPVAPAAFYDLDVAYDAGAPGIVLLVEDRTWRYDGSRWIDAGAAAGVSGLLLELDAACGQLVAHSGAQTWLGAAGAWTESAASQPTSVRDTDMAYDALRERLVRFGGYTDGGGDSEIDETWEWDGSAWTQAAPATSPSPRGGHVMSFDEERGVVVLFGGYDHAETWEYEGTTWTQRVTPTAPTGSFPNGMAYDASRRRTVFYASNGWVWEYFPVGDACSVDDDCASGHCVDEVCCEHVCPGPCYVCSTASGGSKDGICEPVADAGTACEVPDGGALPWEDGGATDDHGSGGGCCRIAGSRGARGGRVLPFVLGATLAVLGARRRRRVS